MNKMQKRENQFVWLIILIIFLVGINLVVSFIVLRNTLLIGPFIDKAGLSPGGTGGGTGGVQRIPPGPPPVIEDWVDICGDGIHIVEECDYGGRCIDQNGNLGQNCGSLNPTCPQGQICQTAYVPSGGPQPPCASCFYLVCGNWRTQPGEACDDGNTQGGDGCSSTCQCESAGCINWCGNGICELGETQTICPYDCGSGYQVCGNGHCDPLMSETMATCPLDCASQLCGNGFCDFAYGENTITCQDCGG